MVCAIFLLPIVSSSSLVSFYILHGRVHLLLQRGLAGGVRVGYRRAGMTWVHNMGIVSKVVPGKVVPGRLCAPLCPLGILGSYILHVGPVIVSVIVYVVGPGIPSTEYVRLYVPLCDFGYCPHTFVSCSEMR